jgi:peptide/nickel transport system substrate-binding protein
MLALTLALVTEPVVAPAQQKVLRVVPQGEVKVFDPHQSQVNLTSMHAALVYDTLFSWDAEMVAQPQMVEHWTVSDDKLLYTFTLRSGLKFSDGSPVTTRDVIATLKRLFLRDSQIQSLAQRVVTLESIDDRTFTLGLKEPFRFVEFLLGGSNGIAGAIMREKEAMTDPLPRSPRSLDRGPSASSNPSIYPARSSSMRKTPSTWRAASRPAASPAGNWPR